MYNTNYHTAGGGDNPSAMKSAIKLMGVGVLCLITGMHLDRKSILKINLSSHFSHNTPEELSANGGKIDSAGDAAAAATDDVGVVKEIAATTKVVEKALNTPVEKIILLGERHSGTNWITDHLQECFGDRVEVSGKTVVVIASFYHASAVQVF
jgi:hypothetical protein